MDYNVVSISKEGKRNRRALAIIFSVLFLGAMLVVGLRGGFSGLFKKNISEISIPAKDIPELTRAKPGETVAEFPKEFILEEGVRIENSMLSNYAEAGQKLFFTTYVSQKNIQTVFYDYKTHFDALKWELTNSLDEPEHKLLFLRAPDKMTSLTVEITSVLNEVRVAVSVTKKEPKKDL